MMLKSLTVATFAVALATLPAPEARADAGDVVGGLIVGGLIGRLPVPSPPGSLLELVKDAATEGDEAFTLAVDYLIEGAEFPSVVELVDGRLVRFDGVELEQGAFVLEARTLPRP